MKQISAHISTILSIVILAASLLPALHAFDHDIISESDSSVINITKTSIDCDLCDFQVANSDAPSIVTYEIYTPQKETVYAISLAETVNLFPNRLFSLRAPPAVIS
ncbi:hypothetical protein [Salegentibacter sp. Hel_I_6]|uniref:hypothetical protein n=1 Tax=Salegentibacter sp. Hel_I_6 TaxID=1250278 RepID=UPI00055A5FB3|nr:hypothetical protein [Salegentibacter sp. Hel_I_6]